MHFTRSQHRLRGWFTPRQKSTIASALTLLCASLIVLIVFAILWVASRFLQTFSGVFLPLAVAAILALVFKPYYEWLEARFRGRRIVAVLVVYLSALLPLIMFFWFFGALLFRQISDLVAQLPEWTARLQAALRVHWPGVIAFWERHQIGTHMRTALEGQSSLLAEGAKAVGLRAISAGMGFFRWIAALLSWIVLPVYLTFFLIARSLPPQRYEDLLPFLKPETRKDVVYLAREFIGILVAFFRGQLLVASLQGALYAAGFMLVGLKYGFALGLALGFLNIIPYLGSMAGLAVTIPLALLQDGGGWSRAVMVLVVITAVQMIEGYVLTPRIMGDRTGLHPMAIIIAVFFWGSALGGISGMILAIPLTAFLVVLWRLLRTKYIFEMV